MISKTPAAQADHFRELKFETVMPSGNVKNSTILRRTDSMPHRDPNIDDLLLGRVKRALHDSGYEQLRSLRAYCHDGRITLQGRVPTYYLKQVAQEILRNITKRSNIDNDVKVTSTT